jgi:hypothetical protein
MYREDVPMRNGESMRASVSGTLAVSLVLFAAGCGKEPAAPEPDPVAPTEPVQPAIPNTGRLTVYVKDMTKVLNLV